MKPIVAFDESGNSGGNLLDNDQTVFVLASVNLTDDEAYKILEPRKTEYKFSRLKRSMEGRRTILAALNSPLLTDDKFLISGFHKLYMTITKMVDLLFEPLAHCNGIDLYERGENIALSNVLFYCLPIYLGRDVYHSLIKNFVQMIRTPNADTVEKFYKLVDWICINHEMGDLSSEYAMLLATRAIAEKDMHSWDGSILDPAIPAFVQQASIWTDSLKMPFRIIHDVAKPIISAKQELEAMMSVHGERVKIGYDRRKMTFPIAAEEIEFHESSSFLQLQVADIIASSFAHCLKASLNSIEDEFTKELRKTRVLNGSYLPVWPEPKVTPEELGTDEVGGIDAASYIGQYVSKRLGANPEKAERQ